MAKPKRICSMEECDKFCFGHGYCHLHYDRWRKYGDPTYRKFIVGENRKDHPLRSTYMGMLSRCNNPNVDNYKYYGGRGIKVCAHWLGLWGFSNFCKDMGNRPEGMTLDRKDVNGNYEPDNCRWATKNEQMQNQRPRTGNTSGVVGVTWDKSAKRWRVQMTRYYKKMYLGVYKSLPEAIIARKRAEESYVNA